MTLAFQPQGPELILQPRGQGIRERIISARRSDSAISVGKPFANLRTVGLAVDRCQFVEGSLVRMYFRLSAPAPLGWSYIFATAWRSLEYPLKRKAGIESDAIWIECLPEEVAAHHFEQLEKVLAQTNEQYREAFRQQEAQARSQAQLQAKLLAQLNEVNQALYPVDVPAVGGEVARRSWFRDLIGKLKLFLRAGN